MYINSIIFATVGVFASRAARVNISTSEYAHLSPVSEMRRSCLSIGAYSFVLGLCKCACVCVCAAVNCTYSYGLPLNKLIKEQTVLQTNQKITSQL